MYNLFWDSKLHFYFQNAYNFSQEYSYLRNGGTCYEHSMHNTMNFNAPWLWGRGDHTTHFWTHPEGCLARWYRKDLVQFPAGLGYW